MKILLNITMFLLASFVTTFAQRPETNSSLSIWQSPYNFVYVSGKVLKPTKIPAAEPLTVLTAIDRVGESLPNEKKIVVKIYRLTLTSNNTDRSIDTFLLKDIRAGRSPNMILQAGDIVELLKPQKIKRPKVIICGL
jgi:protein involved in polysaccharide export with SLBB domain